MWIRLWQSLNTVNDRAAEHFFIVPFVTELYVFVEYFRAHNWQFVGMGDGDKTAQSKNEDIFLLREDNFHYPWHDTLIQYTHIFIFTQIGLVSQIEIISTKKGKSPFVNGEQQLSKMLMQ